MESPVHGAEQNRPEQPNGRAKPAPVETDFELEKLPLHEELDLMSWVQQEVRSRRRLPTVEVEAAGGSLYLRLRERDRPALPLIRPTDHTNFLAVHAVNVSLLAMALAEFVQFDDQAIRKIGVAALLQDIGMARVPLHVIGKPGQITPEEREAIKQHPQEGARVILEADSTLDLAAIVAYEHHMKVDGSGYPKPRFPRPPHYVSRLVQLCDIYHALSSPRPFRQPWPPEIIASFINERAGFEFHPTLATALTTMMQRFEESAQAA
jgi:HD-GYP domain-containing protein (c-di-GMP phosphodiesterase class II)